MADDSLRQKIHRELEAESEGQRGLSPVNWVLFFLILVSLVLYTAETEQELTGGGGGLLSGLNILILLVFGLEFSLRLYGAGVEKRYQGPRGLLRYAKANWFLLLIDFLAFAPELILLAAGIAAPGWLRALRVARLFKIARYFPAFRLIVAALRSCSQELLAALGVAVMLWYLASVALFLAEGSVQPEGFGSITRSMWWSVVTLTTIGYGDIYPVTAAGKILAGLIAILGLGAVALPSGILAGAFMEKLKNKGWKLEEP